MSERLTEEERHFIEIGYVNNELYAKLMRMADECERLRAAIKKHKQSGNYNQAADYELWKTIEKVGL